MAGKQIEFPPNQTHKKSFEQALLIGSLVCIVVTILAVVTVGGA